MRITNKNDIGVVLRQARNRRGLSQWDLGRRIERLTNGSAQQHISRWESGRNTPEWGNLLELADALDCDVELELVPRR